MSQEVIRGIALPPAAQPGDPLARVDTPSLALDLTAFEANLRAMQAWADRHEVALRPHAKAHKCPQIALRQVALGARGICCQKVSEALPFVAAGIRDVHISNEVVGPAKMALLGQLARAAKISVCVDNAQNLAQLSAAMVQAGAQIDVLVEVDVGQGRCGVSDDATVLALAQQARALPGLNFAGLQAYHGSVQHYRTREERATVSRQAARIAASYAQLLRESGIACDTITGGGTGSAEFDAASGVYTELQAGSYAFMDGDYGANEWGGPLNFQNSLFLLSTVMSTPTPDRVVLDAGLKSASAECGPPAVYGESGLTCTAINDEHSVVRVEPGATAPALGSVLRLVPAHVDPTFNLHDGLVVFKDGVVQDIWEISARGFSR
ncbi:DSD1 family PLP-dependent enzyme [Achromobacter sp. K91]|jgi:D-serine deaminase-like pyridoxal phosphate-dependent protein|uniref:D-threonine aldolase n=1 Tax=Achromobacter aegrifaciens TaxID=1287736 RepID=A0AAD2KKN5_ACHAE|nr:MULTISPECIES: DSD1 family PLP-dependent enzyme [Achromobacter]MDQ1764287.1 DSD1 family PLP-dependent enzyme [Achromobacter aegrifaciens]MDR7946304.1 DSD1 family PLP-dependent enzyme [Achromobacter aegrifaciens]RIJ04466.1 DSD1 family PLP-dependent enzyme [Achromobacter sp. K91]CAB3669843.1 D-threonine aldolase [Achromobacter aegrifaciens]CAB3819943.1 D-threonine aldolase [Achromobacter aegrifaciens]